MKKEKSLISKIISWIFMIAMILLIIKLLGIFKAYFFNGFTKAESTIGLSSFKRDSNIRYSEFNSYKIESPEINDAAFYKEVEVEPNTVYRVSCMVKTEDVIPKEVNTDAGANISIIEEAEISKSIIGTNDWQPLELCFNSQARTKLKIGFRLGGNIGGAKGTAWFSDFKLEKGIKSEDSTWNVACFIFKNIDVNINGEQYKFSMSMSDIESVKSNMERYKTACKELSNGKMQVVYKIYEMDDTINTISYSDEHGYYIDPYDVNQYIEDMVLDNEYDFIFITLRMGNDQKQIPVKDWVGLRKYGFIWDRFC